MKNFIASAVAATTLVAGTLLPAGAASSFRTAVIVDPMWHMAAGTIRVPADWGFAGVIVHGGVHNCAVNGAQLRVAAASRDGFTGYDILPVVKSEWVNSPQIVSQMHAVGCPVSTSLHAADYVRQVILPNLHPDARIVSVSEDPDMATILDQRRRADLTMQGPAAASRVYETARVVIAYRLRGRDVEEAVKTATSCQRTQTGGVAGIAVIDDIACIGGPTVLLRAPAGRLAALMNDHSVAANLTMNPQWRQRVEQQNAADAQQLRQDAMAEMQRNRDFARQFNEQTVARAQQSVALIQSIGASSRAAAARKQGAIDRSAGAFSAYVGDYNDYTNPTTGQTTRLSNQYANAYQDDAFHSMGGGAIQLTNSTDLPGAAWVQLIPKY
jgi:hypothetical protein